MPKQRFFGKPPLFYVIAGAPIPLTAIAVNLAVSVSTSKKPRQEGASMESSGKGMMDVLSQSSGRNWCLWGD